MQIYMQITPQDDKPPRFYHLFLQQDMLGGWSLVREWGYQGYAGRVRREHHATLEAAQAALMQARDAQLRRGYRVVFAQGDQPA
ncbi:MAG TPA: WGR domain-containing protein [Gammaproteobacteria bacterium]|nr:WGR domain-containing protein [Gammaproteobacteria bacterium]